jgi:hypothetical protein
MPDSELSLFALVISLSVLVFNITDSHFRRRRELTIRMFERWTSPAFNEYRSRAFEIYNGLNRETRATEFNSDTLSTDPEFIRNFGAIEHFFDDLGRLAKARQLDRSLSLHQFLDSVEFWDGVFTSLDWGNSVRAGWQVTVSKHINRLYKYWKRRRPNTQQRGNRAN